MLNGFGFRTGEAVRWQLYMTTRLSFREQSAYRTADENFNGQVIVLIFIRRRFPLEIRAISRARASANFDACSKGQKAVAIDHMELGAAADLAPAEALREPIVTDR